MRSVVRRRTRVSACPARQRLLRRRSRHGFPGRLPPSHPRLVSSALRIAHSTSNPCRRATGTNRVEHPMNTNNCCQTRSYPNSTAASRKIDEDHDERTANQLAPRRPRHLVHLRFDRDQKIRKLRHVDQAIAEPQPGQQNAAGRSAYRQCRSARPSVDPDPPGHNGHGRPTRRRRSPAARSALDFACTRRS